MPTVREWSAGAVVYHEDADGQRAYLLLRYGAGHWGFPKGHIEGDESELEAMAREITEETAIPAEGQRVVDGFKDETHYDFRRGRTVVQKTVFFYLVRADTRDVSLSHEHSGFEWLPYEAALERVTFRDPRRILEAAHAFLEGKDQA